MSTLYQLRINRFLAERKKLETKSNQIVAGRMVMFVLMSLLVYLSVKLKSSLLLILSMMLLAGFLYLVKKAVVIQRKINYKQILIKINEDEIKALQGDFSAFNPGSNFMDYHHEYSFDLDIFGERSIYQLVNRVATPLGKEKLVIRLLHPGTDANQIRLRQEAAKELKTKVPWRQDFLVTARESDWEQEHSRNVRSWLEAPDRFSKIRFYTIAIWINSIITLCVSLLFVLPYFLPAFLSFSCPPACFLYFLLPISLVISRTRLL
ncbi:MAG: hypothetical protein WC865_10700 [Bacteroidales bacterium]